MTFQELLEYYKNTIIVQYSGKPKLRAYIELLVSAVFCNGNFYDNGNVLGKLLKFSSPLHATGEALTQIALEEGVSRFWSNGAINDDTLRTLVFFRIATNNSNNTIAEIDNLLFQTFGTDLFYQWNMNMTVTIYATFPNELVQIAVEQNLFPLPTCVGYVLIINTEEITFVDTITNEEYDLYDTNNNSTIETLQVI